MRSWLTGLGATLLALALVAAFLGHSDLAFVLAATWLVILIGGLLLERAMRKPEPK